MDQEKIFTGAPRRVTIGSITKQSSNGRITFPISMPLAGEMLGDLPEWVSDGFDAVVNSFTEVDPEVQQVSDIMLAFTNDKPSGKLFKNPDAKIPNAELRGFKITRVGDPEDPEVELHFKAFAPFSRDFWAWLGEMAGAEVWMAFPTSLARSPAKSVEQSEKLPLEATDEPGKAASAPEAPKAGPKALAALAGKPAAGKAAAKVN